MAQDSDISFGQVALGMGLLSKQDLSSCMEDLRGGSAKSDLVSLVREKGLLNESDIARVVLTHKGGIRGCYNRTLLRSPEDEGEVAVRFVISTRGSVTEARVMSSTVNDPELEQCVLERIAQWVFPPEPGCETVVRYSFHFTFDR